MCYLRNLHKYHAIVFIVQNKDNVVTKVSNSSLSQNPQNTELWLASKVNLYLGWSLFLLSTMLIYFGFHYNPNIIEIKFIVRFTGCFLSSEINKLRNTFQMNDSLFIPFPPL